MTGYLVENVAEQLGVPMGGKMTTAAQVVEFINGYVKTHPEAKAAEYFALMSLALISAKYIEGVKQTSKEATRDNNGIGESKAYQLMLEVLERAGYANAKADLATSL